MITRCYVLHALSPLHAGTGEGSGFIDLPIARDRASEHPVVPGSSVKGVLRDAARLAGADTNVVFGSADGSASMVRVSDARVLAFPVKSDRGTFAWVTSPYVLWRFVRDVGQAAGFDVADVKAVKDGQAVADEHSAVVDKGGRVTLDGLPFVRATPDARAAKALSALARAIFPGSDPTSTTWRAFFAERLVVLEDGAFTAFTQTATDVRAHIRIDEETGTVKRGALWYTETLPSETILAGVVQVAAERPGQDQRGAFEVLTRVASGPLRVGGDATTGAGRVRLVIGEGVS